MENQLNLFDTSKLESKVSTKKNPTSSHLTRKLIPIERSQINFKLESLDSALPLNHDARTIWKFVELLDLSKADAEIESIESCSGRPAINPRVLIALWIYGISEGFISSRKIAKFCKDHKGFAWICGGASVGHHVLSKFRAKSSELFEQLVVQSVSFLVFNDLIEIKQVAQDGVKVQANCSKGSFRRKKTLKEMKVQMTKHVRDLEAQQKNGVFEKQEKIKKERELRDAKEKEKRLKEALKELDVLKNQRNKSRKKNKNPQLSKKEIKELRASKTEADARKMRMADGSYKSAYNVQISTEVESEVALGVRISKSGTDGGEMLPMYEDLKLKYNSQIDTYLVDRGYRSVDDLQSLHKEGTCVYMPTKGQVETLKEKVLSGEHKGITEAEIDWIKRMETDEGKKHYKRRIRVSETINAYFRNHGLGQLLVRGIKQVVGFINLSCLTYNMTVIDRLYPLQDQ